MTHRSLNADQISTLMFHSNQPWFDPECRKEIAVAFRRGLRFVTLKGRAYILRQNRNHPKYLFVNLANGDISAASACLEKDRLLSLC
jgi:hypothetical protein